MNIQHLNRYKALGLKIAYFRKQKGLSQMELSERVNISRTHMSRIETAECAVSLDIVFEICAVLEIEPEKLFAVE